jgi:hypothetical protein
MILCSDHMYTGFMKPAAALSAHSAEKTGKGRVAEHLGLPKEDNDAGRRRRERVREGGSEGWREGAEQQPRGSVQEREAAGAIFEFTKHSGSTRMLPIAVSAAA